MNTHYYVFAVIFGNLFFYSFYVAEAYKVEVGDGPVESVVSENVVLECSYIKESSDDDDRPQVSWYKGEVVDEVDTNRILTFPRNKNTSYYPNEDTFNSPKFTSTLTNVNADTYAVDLHISGVQTTDSGDYTCSIYPYDQGTIVLDVQALSAPTSVAVAGTSPVVEGDSTTLTCTSDGYPTPTCTWKHPDANRPTPTPDSCLLDLTSLQRSDAGTYTCTATNSIGSDEDTFELDVQYVPDSPWPNCSASPESGLEAGDQLTMTCIATDGNPAPSLEWFRGTTSVDDSYSTPAPGSSNGDTLNANTIQQLSSGDNGATFTCKGEHLHVSAEVECSIGPLDVRYSPSGDPHCNATASSGSIEGNELTLTCTAAAGNPPAELAWSTDGTTVSPSSNTVSAADNSTSHNYTLTLSREDNGKTYECSVSHDLYEGSPKTCQQTLDVEYSPIITKSEDGNADEGGVAVLRCEAEGNPPPDTFTWTKDNIVITGTEDYIDLVESDPVGFTSYSTLTIGPVVPGRDYGDYICNASNTHGDDISTINLDGTTVPEPPEDVSVTDATDTALTVTWVGGQDGGYPQSFIVEYRVYESGADWKIDDEDQPPVTLTDLQPDTTYEIRVKSQNKLGESPDYSETITFSTTETPGNQGQSSDDDTPIIIGVAVGGVLLIAIVILVVMIFRRKGGKSESKRDHEMNPYIDDTRRFLNEGASSSDTPNIYAEVKKDGKSKPKKSDKTPTNPPNSEQAPQLPPPFIGNGEELVSYENAYGKRSEQAKKQVPDENPYEVTEKPQEEKQNKNPDGLVYAELDLKTPPKAVSQKPTPQHGETTYASIDFNKKAPGGSGLP